MDVQLKQRVVGAAVLAALAVIFVPVLLDDGRRHEPAPLPPPVMPDSAHVRPPNAPTSAAIEDIQKGMNATTEELARMPLEPRVPPEPDGAFERPAKAEGTDGGTKSSDGAARPAEQWIVQIGTYANEANAAAQQTKIKRAGIATTIVKPQTAGKPYRLHAGPLPSKDKAEALRRRLEKDYDIKAIVRRLP